MKNLWMLVALTALASPSLAEQATTTKPASNATPSTPTAAPAGPAGSDVGAGPASLSFAGTAGPGVQVLLNAERKDKKGIVALDWGTGTTSMRLALSAPLNTSEETVPASLAGLSNGAEIRYALSSFTSPGPNPEEAAKLIALCEPVLEKHNAEIRALNTEIEQRNAGRPPAEQLPKLSPVTIDDCDRVYIARRDLEKLPLYDYYQHLQDPIWLRGLEIGASQTTYTFVTTPKLSSQRANKTSVSAALRAGRYTVPTGFVIGSVAFTRNYEAAGQAQNLCRTLDNADDTKATTCSSVVIGVPTRTDRLLGSLEIRKFFSDYRAVTPALTFGRTKTEAGAWTEVWSVDVPIYFIEGQGGTLGGIRLGWRSDKREVTAALFIGGAIGLLK